jgi:hypothetical protein
MVVLAMSESALLAPAEVLDRMAKYQVPWLRPVTT